MSFKVFHDPTCECGADLTKHHAVVVTYSTGGHIFERPSEVYPSGKLRDTEDRLIENGYHAGSHCAACGEQIEELEEEPDAQEN